jgi:hypothetical protein
MEERGLFDEVADKVRDEVQAGLVQASVMA